MYIIYYIFIYYLTPFFILNLSFLDCIRSRRPQPNYYWRRYEGVVPHDAIPGGHTANGCITYIGQILNTVRNENVILPGTIQIGKEEVVVPYYGAHKSKTYAMVRRLIVIYNYGVNYNIVDTVQ